MLLAERGAKVVVCDIGAELDGSGNDVSVASGVVAEIEAAGGTAVADTSDISTFAGAAGAVQVAVDTFGRIDILVNNAGLAGGGGPIETVTEAQLQKSFAVNFYGSIGPAQAAWPHMKAQRWGRIVNTVSEVALDSRGGGGGIGYGAAKAAIWSATLSMAEAGREHGITVNAISPGAFTRMNERLFAERGGPPPGLDLDPLHVARVAAWLASDDAADVTGKVIHAAGGQHREYLTQRFKDTELVARVDAGVAKG
jgi:NAD(P)-dependent dehydrogenase (short-subunit alcohol dehydrogenase family)